MLGIDFSGTGNVRRGTKAAWAVANFVLGDGETGIETDTGQKKVGDGVTPWNGLAYDQAAAVSATAVGSGLVAVSGKLNSSLASPFTGISAANLPKFRLALQKAIAGASGASSTTMLFMGDSKTAGHGGGSDGSADLGIANQRATWRMVQNLKAAGLPFSIDSFMGTEYYASLTDSRLSYTFPQYGPSGGAPLGGGMFQIAASGNTLSFNYSDAADSFDFYYLNNQGGGTLAFTVNGTALANFTIPSTGTKTIAKVNIPFARTTGGGTIKIDWVAGTLSYFVGLVCKDSVLSRVNVVNGAAGGAQLSGFMSGGSGFSAQDGMLPLLAPSFVNFSFGTNEVSSLTAPATLLANLNSFTATAKAAGADCGYEIFSPLQIAGNFTQAAQDAMSAAIIAAQTANGGLLTDLRPLYGNSWTVANTRGQMFDSLHENRLGHFMRGLAWAEFVKLLVNAL